MAIYIPNGSTISIASTYGAPTNTTAVSNATEAVATVVSATGITQGGIVEVTSGWSKLNGRIARVKTLASLAATLEKIDTSNVSKFPAGSGIGSVRPITAWTQITQVLDSDSTGGDQAFTTYSFLEDATERQIPTNKSAQGFTLDLGDDANLPWFDLLSVADDDKLPRAIRVSLSGGGVIYYNCFCTLNKTPSLKKNEVAKLRATFSLVADVTRYAS